MAKLDLNSVANTSQGEVVSAKEGLPPITVGGAGSDGGIGNLLMSDVGTPMRRRNLKSPMILPDRKYRSPNARGGSLD